MLLNSLVIYGYSGEYETVTLYVTDSVADVKAKLDHAYHTNTQIERLDEEISVIRAGNLPIYNDRNISFDLYFDNKGKFINADVNTYYSEEDVVVLSCVDDMDNEVIIDFTSESICDCIDQNNQETFTLLDETEQSDDVYVYRGRIESPVGDWVLIYPEQVEPFTALSILLDNNGKISYPFGNTDLLTLDTEGQDEVVYRSKVE